jgi:hypothetical protein
MDMVPEGFAITSTFSKRTATCRIVFNQKDWEYIKWCTINQGCNDVTNNFKYSLGNEVYLAYGESLKFGIRKPLFGDNYVSGVISYYQKQLYKKTWTGRKDLIGIGCDMRTLLSSSEWNKLPAGANLSLDVGQTINFVDVFIELPMVGNVMDYYGVKVMASPTTGGKYNLYEVNLNSQATPNSAGVYNSQGGACYYVPGRLVATVDCLPGQQAMGMACGNDFKWVTLDKGACIRGGVAYDDLCPGNGLYIDKTSYQMIKYSCNVNTGMCDVVWKKSIQCYPGQIPCPGGYICDEGTYTCIPSEQQLKSCSYEWCPEGMGYVKKDCPFGLKPCPDFTCREKCGEITPLIANQEQYKPGQTKQVGGINWSKVWAVLVGLLAFLVIGRKDIEKRKMVGIAIAGIIAFMLAYFTFLILENIKTIILGSIVLGIAGAVLWPIIGPAVIVIVLLIAYFIAIVKGGGR